MAGIRIRDCIIGLVCIALVSLCLAALFLPKAKKTYSYRCSLCGAGGRKSTLSCAGITYFTGSTDWLPDERSFHTHYIHTSHKHIYFGASCSVSGSARTETDDGYEWHHEANTDEITWYGALKTYLQFQDMYQRGDLKNMSKAEVEKEYYNTVVEEQNRYRRIGTDPEEIVEASRTFLHQGTLAK